MGFLPLAHGHETAATAAAILSIQIRKGGNEGGLTRPLSGIVSNGLPWLQERSVNGGFLFFSLYDRHRPGRRRFDVRVGSAKLWCLPQKLRKDFKNKNKQKASLSLNSASPSTSPPPPQKNISGRTSDKEPILSHSLSFSMLVENYLSASLFCLSLP